MEVILMKDIDQIRQKLSALNEEERTLKAEISKRKERIKKLNSAKKALKLFSQSVESGKMESILRFFAEE
jgi:regulator of replication initiation timing